MGEDPNPENFLQEIRIREILFFICHSLIIYIKKKKKHFARAPLYIEKLTYYSNGTKSRKKQEKITKK